MPLWGPFALIAVGIMAIYVEVFVPAGGLIGVVGGGAIVAAVVVGFQSFGPATGTLVLVTALVATPFAVAVGFKLFPRTRVGRGLILSTTLETESPHAHLLGAVGVAVTVLRPSGTARFGERNASVVTGGEFVEAGTPIQVTRVEGARIVVVAVAPAEQQSLES